jgi:hypothetical protein
VTLIVNGRKKVVQAFELSFESLIDLAYENPPTGENVMFHVTYRHGPEANPKGTMVAGQCVAIQDGMIFNVRDTDKS